MSSPTIPIPAATGAWTAPPGGGNLQPGQTASGGFAVGQIPPGPNPPPGGLTLQVPPGGMPRVRQTWQINSIFVPVGVAAEPVTTTTPPTVANVQLNAGVRGQVLWTATLTVTLVTGGTPDTSTGNNVVNDQFYSPIEITPGDPVEFSWLASFDQAVKSAEVYLSAAVSQTSSTTAPTVAPAPGLFGATFTPDD